MQHVNRNANEAAHFLAQHAKGIDAFVTWIEECPSFLESIVFQDAIYVPILALVIKISQYSLSKKKPTDIL